MRPPTDDELLALLHQTEEADRRRTQLEEVAEPAPHDDLEGEPCTHCGELALTFDACNVCHEDGCLPRDDWHPGIADPCLTRCERCGNLTHRDCATPSHSGNLLCLDCKPAAFEDE